MKKLMLIALMLAVKSISAQNTVTLSGFFKERYRSVKLSKEVNRLLFVKHKGHFQLPPYDHGYFLNLTKQDATKIGVEDVLVIPLNEGVFRSDKDVKTLDVVQLSNSEPSIFYTKENNVDKGISYNKRIFTNPTLKDTVSWDEITNSDFHYTKEWIDNLDNEKEVTLKSYILYETDRGGGKDVQFSKIKIKELAIERLHRIVNLFDLVEDESWTKMHWQNWFDTTVNHQEPTLNECNPYNYNISKVYKYGESNTMLYGADQEANKLLGIQSLPYNVDQYKDRQMVVIDSTKYYQYDYYTETQKQTHSVRAFESLNNKLYFIDFYGNWSSFETNSTTGLYSFKEKREIILPEITGKRTDYYLSHVQTNQNLMFAIIGNEKSKEFYIATIQSQTGETLRTKSLKDLLANTDIDFNKNIEIVHLKYGLKTSQDFVFGIKQGDDYFLVKTDKDLGNTKLIKTSKIISQATVFVHDKTIDVLKSNNSSLQKVSFDADLKTMLSNEQKEIENWYYDENGVVVYDGVNYKLFAPYRLSQYSGINLLILNDKLETVKKQCVYQFLPLEEPEYDNSMHLEFATKINSDWWVLFRKGTTLRYAKVKLQ